MKRGIAFLLSSLFALVLSGAALAAAGSVKIGAPAEGAVLAAKDRHAIDYEVDPGLRGNHVHLYDNGSEIAIVRTLKGRQTLGKLAPGPHEFCLKVVNRAHVPIGVEDCVKVEVR